MDAVKEKIIKALYEEGVDAAIKSCDEPGYAIYLSICILSSAYFDIHGRRMYEEMLGQIAKANKRREGIK